ncbi:hypothetical protein F2P81_005215 [Scophthalmus maximus]|uniref:Uncharacterized protein n=1 Tax=Scophthalmus maximus TaxID=52904 RepID=A0A6A4T6N3_SCOMX|nr:hypothetical protein F2P81_005215 [Scophthalmus maximus]
MFTSCVSTSALCSDDVLSKRRRRRVRLRENVGGRGERTGVCGAAASNSFETNYASCQKKILLLHFGFTRACFCSRGFADCVQPFSRQNHPGDETAPPYGCCQDLRCYYRFRSNGTVQLPTFRTRRLFACKLPKHCESQ